MILCSPRSDGIRWILGIHGIREDIDQELVPLVTPSPPFSPEGLTKVGYDPIDVIYQHGFTGEDKSVWLGSNCR